MNNDVNLQKILEVDVKMLSTIINNLQEQLDVRMEMLKTLIKQEC